MVQSVRMAVPASDDAWWRRPAAVRSFAYELLRLGSEVAASSAHEADGTRAFTIGVLPDRICQSIRPFTTGPGGPPPEGAQPDLHVRFCALETGTRNAMLAGLMAAAMGARLPVGDLRLSVRDVVIDEAPWAECAQYQALADAHFSPQVRLLFLTPTAFSQGGDRHLPLPVPDLMLRSWHRRCNEFAPEQLRIPNDRVEFIIGRVALSGVSIRSRSVPLDPPGEGRDPGRRPGRVVGFVGDVALNALRPQEWPPEASSAFAALTAYSAYCGTGARTTQGFGLTIPFCQGTEP